MKKLFNTAFFLIAGLCLAAQTSTRDKQNQKKEERREKINTLKKQAEEGILVYRKQNIFGVQLRTNGYGAFYEMGKMKTNRKTNIYRVDFTEIKHYKEDKVPAEGIFFGNPFIYGKVNNFYQLTLGVGQQYMLGQKGNKNGVAVSMLYNGGLSLGMLRPYYLEVKDPRNGDVRLIKYDSSDSLLFLDEASILGSGGITKGWGEIKITPGAFAKIGIRFDYGRFNEIVSGLELGVSAEIYSKKMPVLLYQKERQFFYQGYLAILFGKRK